MRRRAGRRSSLIARRAGRAPRRRRRRADPDARRPSRRRVTFDDAIRVALERHPDAARAAQAILRAEALLQASRSVFLPTLNGTVTTTS